MTDPFETVMATDQTDIQSEAEPQSPVSDPYPNPSKATGSSDAEPHEPPPVVEVSRPDPDLELLHAKAQIEMMIEALKVIVMELERSETQASMSRTRIALGVARAALDIR